MKKLLIVSATLLLLVGCSSTQETSSDMATLQEQVNRVEAQTAELRDEATSLKTEAMSLDKKVDMLNSKVDGIKEALAE